MPAEHARRLRRRARAILRAGAPPRAPQVSVEALALLVALRTLPIRQRQLRLAGGAASLLVVVLVAGAMLVDRVAGGLGEPGPRPPVAPPSTQALPRHRQGAHRPASRGHAGAPAAQEHDAGAEPVPGR